MNVVKFNKSDDLINFHIYFKDGTDKIIKCSAIDTSSEPFVYFIKELNKEEYRMIAMYQMSDIKAIEVDNVSE